MNQWFSSLLLRQSLFFTLNISSPGSHLHRLKEQKNLFEDYRVRFILNIMESLRPPTAFMILWSLSHYSDYLNWDLQPWQGCTGIAGPSSGLLAQERPGHTVVQWSATNTMIRLNIKDCQRTHEELVWTCPRSTYTTQALWWLAGLIKAEVHLHNPKSPRQQAQGHGQTKVRYLMDHHPLKPQSLWL